ncbi:MAG: hypothetical protein ACM3O3_12715 [Syntrophothermus sp.]
MAGKKKVTEENAVIEVEENVKEVVVEKIPDNIKPDEIYISGKGLIKLKGTKLKYFKDGSYNNYMLIKSLGINEVLRYNDGDDVLKSYISAVLDIDKESINFIDEMTTDTLFEMIEKINKINDIKDTDFLNQMETLGVMNEE